MLDRVARLGNTVGAAKVEEVGVNQGDDILGEVGYLERDRCSFAANPSPSTAVLRGGAVRRDEGTWLVWLAAEAARRAGPRNVCAAFRSDRESTTRWAT